MTRRNKAWVTDITCIRTWQGWLYLAVAMDLFSQTRWKARKSRLVRGPPFRIRPMPEALQFHQSARRLERRRIINDTSSRSIEPSRGAAAPQPFEWRQMHQNEIMRWSREWDEEQQGEHFMNIQHYRQRLIDLEKTLSARIGREANQGRGEFIDSAHDIGDASVADAMASEEFAEAEHNASVLQQVRDALGRVADGTFGTCIVDGGPIEEPRLEAVPWTPYCLKHAQRLEVAASPSTPTL
jgi:DnaK suppressor protein